MPTYEYRCEKCGKEFECFQSMTDRPLAVCPKDMCGMKKWGKGKVKRLLSAGSGLIFKGSGFYITDYRSDSYKAAAKKDTGAGSGSSASGSGGGEKKPAAKPAKGGDK